MKKKILGLFIFVIFLMPFKVDAASISITPSTKSAVVGGNLSVTVSLYEGSGLGSWEYSLRYDSDKLQLLSGDTHVVDVVGGTGETSRSYKYSFRVLKEGNANISVVNASVLSYDEVPSSPTASTTVNLYTKTEVTKNYSKDNNLKSLEVEGYTLTPEFNKDTLEYSLEVESDVTKVNIKATANDNKAKVNGDGEKDVLEGANRFEIVVTSESGAEKKYVVTINVKEKTPINVKVNSKEFTVVRKEEEIKDLIKDYFVKTTIKIGEEEVTAYDIESIGVTLVPLKDSKGNIDFYIYEKNKYSLYEELSSGNLTIHILDNIKKIPEGYKKYKVEINNKKYNVYKLNKNSKYYLVYAENIESGKSNLYLYDSIDKTIQRYNDEEIESIRKEQQIMFYIIIGLLSLLVISIGIFITILYNNKKRNKKEVKKRLKDEKKDFLK